MTSFCVTTPPTAERSRIYSPTGLFYSLTDIMHISYTVHTSVNLVGTFLPPPECIVIGRVCYFVGWLVGAFVRSLCSF